LDGECSGLSNKNPTSLGKWGRFIPAEGDYEMAFFFGPILTRIFLLFGAGKVNKKIESGAVGLFNVF
jgi:hypothetical protein